MRELVLEPIGLERCFFDAGDVMTYRFAVGHNASPDGARVARPWPLVRSAYPAGGLTCGAQDLLRYARFHLGAAEDGSPLLSPGSLAAMQSPQVRVWGDEAWGLSWAVAQVGGTRQVRHGGGTKGQVTLLTLVPEHDFALVVLTNADQGGHVTDDVRRWALKEYLNLEDPKPLPLETPEGELAQYAGRYQGYYTDAELGMLAGKLIGQITYKRAFPSEEVAPAPAPPPLSLGLCEQDRLLVLDGQFKGATAEVIRQADGAIGWLRQSGRLHARET
jgi:hypothetical protein